MTDWDARNLTLDFAFLGEGVYQATIFKDGMNADRDGTDYKKEVINISSGDKLNIQLATRRRLGCQIGKNKNNREIMPKDKSN